ncbi:SDR family oxidoreductase [Mumia sp. zg.B53]|uniref:SDR family oxidoreductase n=1 Tax=Mumia sp. zg.B53 TaxID=2855449 RepID=UPI001C6E2104|nr:SDR family oxidoreductase [Mumia sp. zg.B53]MBW9214782.1 SDR family oxidoreductase [Mumia sp. zg.B53]
MPSSFTGKVAVVTGAARGIGAGVAREYVRRGGRVALLGLEPDELKSLAAELGDAADWWEADVRDTDAVQSAVDAAADRFGRIDHVLANAGIAAYGTVRQIDPGAFERVVDVNLNGVFRTLRAAAPHVIATKGYVLVVSSLAAFTPLAGLAPYNASKAGVEALALAYRQEMWVHGVKVGVCHPSWIDTDIVRGAEDDLPSFKAIRGRLPWPANGTTSLEECVEAVTHGLEKKKRRVYVPKGVLVANLTKPLFSSAVAEPIAKRLVKRTVPQMEREVAALGRSHSAHVPVTDAK